MSSFNTLIKREERVSEYAWRGPNLESILNVRGMNGGNVRRDLFKVRIEDLENARCEGDVT
jgi:hypothetical protein